MTWTDLVLLASLASAVYFTRLIYSTWRAPEFQRELQRYREIRRHRKAARRS
jgi:hypothetical protein